MDRLLVVFVDALGPSQRERSRALRELAPFERTLRGVAGFSSGALATVLTGASSAEHGRLCLFSARSKSAPRSPLDALAWLRFLPSIVHERGAVRRRLARWLAEREKLTGYVALHRVEPSMFRWLDIPEREDLFEAKDIGGVPTFLSDARARGIDVYAARWALDEATRWRSAFDAMRARPARLNFLYSSELDGVLHSDGPDENSAERVLARVAERISEAQSLLSRDGSRVRTVIVGDHGMARVGETIDPRAVLDRSGVRHFVDSTMARLWGTSAQIELARLGAERAGWPARFIDRAGLEAWSVGVNESLWGQAWLVLDEGALFAPSHVGGFVRGMHGYGPDASSSRAALCSDGEIDPSVTELRSVAGWVRSMMGAWR
jgi:hypothetical protein